MISSKRSLRSTLLILLFLVSSRGAAAQSDSVMFLQHGQQLFNTYCSPCHGVHQAKLGPMLASITRKRPPEWLHAFIRNSQKVILSGDQYANFLFKEYDHVVMPSFDQLSGQQINAILHYIDIQSQALADEQPGYPLVNTLSNKRVMRGKEIFSQNCANCHKVNQDGYGPALGSVTRRRPLPWLISFIQNSQQLIAGGDDYAVYLYHSYDNKIMPSFEFLPEDDILSVLDFIAYASAAPHPVAGSNSRKDRVQPMAGPAATTDNRPEARASGRIPFKLMLIIFSLMGAIIHIILIVKLFLYLRRGN